MALSRGGSGTVDVIEIDAASHGGVDDARDLRERASYGPAQSRYKIYIIDEAHMVTPQGFNALLKIVEEPPEHVKFVFATTEPEKVIGTIRSRTHHYPFRLVPPARLQAYMEELCVKEGVAVAPGVLSFVVRAGGGSVRDSLSVLDQLIAGSGPDGLTYESAAALLGFTDGELLDASIDAFAAGDAAAVFRAIDKVVDTGLDPRRFVEDLLERLRDLIVVAALPDGAGQVLRHVPEDQLERMRRQAAAFGPGALSRAADVVNSGLTEMTGATAPRLQLELIAARILLPGAAGEAGYAARLDRLERRLDVGGRADRSRPVRRAVASCCGRTAVASCCDRAGGGFRSDRTGCSDRCRGCAVVPGAPGVGPRADPGCPLPGCAGVGAAGAPEDDDPREPEREPRAERDEPASGAQPAPTARPDAAPMAVAEPEPVPVTHPRGPGGLDTDALRRSWPDVLEWLSRHKRVTWTFVSQNAQVLDYDGQRVLLGISTVGLADTFRRGAHADYVRQALIDVLGVDARVDGIPFDDVVPAAPPGASAPSEPSAGPAAASTGGIAPAPGGASSAPSDAGSGSPNPVGSGTSADASALGAAAAATRVDAATRTREPASWSDAPPPPDTAPSWASPLERARVAVEAETVSEQRVVDDTAISDDDESIDDLTDVGVPVVERILGGTVIARDPQ